MLSYSSYLGEADEQVHQSFLRIRQMGRTYKFHISTHLRDLAHLHHDQFVHLWIALFVIPHLCVFEEKR